MYDNEGGTTPLMTPDGYSSLSQGESILNIPINIPIIFDLRF